MRVIAESRDITAQVDVETNHVFRSDAVPQYIRRSSETQKNNNRMSEVLQDEKMQARLESKGFIDFEKIDVDDGQSGQKMLEDRAGLEYLYDLIKGKKRINGKLIGAVGAFNASRLWRDPSHVYYNDFIAMLVKYKVPFIDYKRVYWPDSYNCPDMDALRAEFVKSLATLQQITDYALPARYEAVNQGSYGGHCVPMGFIVTGTKSERKYNVYEPHRELVEYVFKRFKALNGNLSRLYRELRDSDFAFPEFDSSVTEVPHVGLDYVAGKGYVIKTRNGLISLLTNTAYIGHYVFTRREPATIEYDDQREKRVRRLGKPTASYVNEHHHEAIIDRDLFEYAYTTLTGTTLTGEVVNAKPERRQGMKTKALLEGIVFSDGDTVYCSSQTQVYIGRVPGDDRLSSVVVPIAQLDSVFSRMVDFILTLGNPKDINKLVEAVEQAKEQSVEKRTSTKEDLERVLSGIHGWELDKESCRNTGNVHGLNEANTQLAILYARRDSIQTELNRAEYLVDCASKLTTLVQKACEKWDRWPFEQRRLLTKLLVRYADVREVSPHILKLEVIFNYWPHQMSMCFYRSHGSKETWSDTENDILKRMYKSADRLDILKSLPSRNWGAILMQAKELGLERATILNTSDIPLKMSYSDRQMLRELGISLEEHLQSSQWKTWAKNQIDANSLPNVL
jgi:Recombinase